MDGIKILERGFLGAYGLFVAGGIVGVARNIYYKEKEKETLCKLVVYTARYALSWYTVFFLLGAEDKPERTIFANLPFFVVCAGISPVLSVAVDKKKRKMSVFQKLLVKRVLYTGSMLYFLNMLEKMNLMQEVGIIVMLNLFMYVMVMFRMVVEFLSSVGKMRKDAVTNEFIKENVHTVLSFLGIRNYSIFTIPHYDFILPCKLETIVVHEDFFMHIAIDELMLSKLPQETLLSLIAHHVVEWRRGYFYTTLFLGIMVSKMVCGLYFSIVLGLLLEKYSFIYRFLIAEEMYVLAQHMQSLVFSYLTVIFKKRVLETLSTLPPEIRALYKEHRVPIRYTSRRMLSLPDMDLFYAYTEKERARDIKRMKF
ncbi:hypothetical protein NECID01_0188 [Nematocida sp. AWRm77]|nr:hypothetical protein NECID01_0188 [Nematocida sp. AWRm77]